MKLRFKRKPVIVTVIIAVAAVLIGAEVFLLSASVRGCWVDLLDKSKSMDSLVGMLDDDDQDVRVAASQALVRHGPVAVPALIRGLARLDVEGRVSAVFTLGGIGPKARDAIPALKQRAVVDDSDRVREGAALALGVIASEDATTVSELLVLLDTGNDAERLAAARAVVAFRDEDKRRAVPILIRVLKHPTPRIREEAAEALGRFGQEGRPAIATLLETLSDSDPRVRAEAQEALEHISRGPGWDDPALRDQMDAAIAKWKATAPIQPPEPPRH